MAKRKKPVGNTPPDNQPDNQANNELINKLDKQVDLLNEILKIQTEFHEKQQESVDEQEELNRQITNSQKAFKLVREELGDIVNNLYANSVEYLKESDKALKSVNISLGTSGALASTYRDNMMAAAHGVASLGGSLKDLAETQIGFTEETGKLAPLSESALKRSTAMSKAIGLGASESGKLVGNFNTIGYSAEDTASFVESTLNSSERMGISGTKVVKTLASNFDKINKYNFKGGVEAFKSMVQFSEKTKQNLDGVFNAAEKFRTIEGAIEASAELQTLGGAMANADGFQLGFLARNDPEQFAKEIHKMTEGIYSFDKASGEFKASAVDLDRLRRMAEITGQDFNELSKEARKASETKFMSSKMFGLSKDDKELVSQLATFDKTSKKFTVKLDGKDVDISKLTTDQLSLLKDQQKTLEERTKANQAFDEVYNNTLMELKTALLPILKGINWMFNQFNTFFGESSGYFETLSKTILLGAGAIGVGVVAKMGTAKLKDKVIGNIGSVIGGGKGGGKIGGNPIGNPIDKLPAAGDLDSKGNSLLKIGAAIAMIGAGIGVVATGIGYMADNFAKLNPEQMDGVLTALTGLGIGITVLGGLGMVAGPGLLAVGGGIALIGAGIGIAATGIGYMASQFATLSNPDLGKNVLSLAGGVASLAGSAALFANPLSIAGLLGFTTAMHSLDNIGDIKPLTDFMLAPKDNLVELRETINLLKGADLKGLSELKEMLSELSSKPLTVEFKDKDVKLNVNTTLMLDRDVLLKNLQIGKTATIEVVKLKRGT